MKTAVFDTSVLIPLGYCSHALDFIACLNPAPSRLPTVVDYEVRRDPARTMVSKGLRAGVFELDDLSPQAVMQAFVTLTQELDPGEAAVVAIAQHGNGRAVTNDKAALKIARRELGDNSVVDLIDLLVEVGKSGCQPVEILDGMVEAIRAVEAETVRLVPHGCTHLINSTKEIERT